MSTTQESKNCQVCGTDKDIIVVCEIPVCSNCNAKADQEIKQDEKVSLEGKIPQDFQVPKIYVIGTPQEIARNAISVRKQLEDIESRIKKTTNGMKRDQMYFERKQKKLKVQTIEQEKLKDTLEAVDLIKKEEFKRAQLIGKSEDDGLRIKKNGKWYTETNKEPFAKVIELKASKKQVNGK